jgi:hypothetical protein
MQASTAGSSGGVTGLRIQIHSATCTVGWSESGFCTCMGYLSTTNVVLPASSRDYVFKTEPEKPPKYDPFHARLMWARDALQETSRPKKRPSQQVEFNQVSRLRPVRPRYLSRKR